MGSMALTSDAILKRISSMEDLRRYGVRRIGLFGSYARGEPGLRSDVEILVEFEDGKKPLTIT